MENIINIEKEAENISDKLDLFEPHERMAIFEYDVEKKVKEYRNSLNKKIVSQLNDKLCEHEAVVCEEGHSLYKYKDKKKSSLLHTKN